MIVKAVVFPAHCLFCPDFKPSLRRRLFSSQVKCAVDGCFCFSCSFEHVKCKCACEKILKAQSLNIINIIKG